jgi:EAL domain-containing protein (putative c-di-GMP-specific phosphodiesterase class I)
VAVNLSAMQFRRADMVATVREALEASGLSPQWLELELTESLLMQSGAQVENTLAELKALGVRMSIDDFGTGYSSLAYLKRFPVDCLKIDRSFVNDLIDDPDDAAIVRAVIQLGRSLRLDVIAEGTETHEQWTSSGPKAALPLRATCSALRCRRRRSATSSASVCCRAA